MKIKLALLVAACALALAGCAEKTPEVTDNDAAAVESAPAVVAPMEAPVTTPESAVAATDKPAAVVVDCATEIEGTDAMQYNVGSIVVPASCTEFKITLKHAGKMPVAAMGHNVVIARTQDMAAVTTAGMAAGVDNGYVKPNDGQVIAHSKMIGGGESTSISFAVSKIQGPDGYEFFCSFPGHSALMKGSIAVE